MIAHGRLIEVDPLRPETVAAAAGMAEEAVATDGLVIMPTETVYGIACRPDHSGAIGRLFEAKGRPLQLLLPVLAATVASAWEVAQPNPAAEALAEVFDLDFEELPADEGAGLWAQPVHASLAS